MQDIETGDGDGPHGGINDGKWGDKEVGRCKHVWGSLSGIQCSFKEDVGDKNQK